MKKTVENQLTERIIFDTIIKHLTNRLKAERKGVNPKKSAEEISRKKSKKRVDRTLRKW